MLLREVNDPRFAGVTLSEVEVSRDLSHAKVYVTLPAGADASATVKALNNASGYLRHGLSQRLHLRYLPALRFEHDTALERAHRLTELIDTAVAEDERREREAGGQGEKEG